MTAHASPGASVSGPENQELRRRLLTWFDQHQRDLPWRGIADPYRTWVSEIMLQQTQVERVIPYFERFIASYPTVRALAGAPLEEVLRAWEGLGYYSRARNLHAAARIVVAEHSGEFPRTVAQARALPGVGEYTAGAILSIAYGLPVPAVDANAARVLARIFLVRGGTHEASFRRAVRSIAEQAVAADRPGDLNQALMELGALICVAGRPGCLLCPVRDLCRARGEGVETEIPPPRARASRHERRVGAVVRQGERVLVAQRPADGYWAGLWEFPSLEWEADEPEQALAAWLRTALGVQVEVGPVLTELSYGIMDRQVALQVHECRRTGGRLRPREHTQARWVRLTELADLPMPSPHRRLAGMLCAPR